jgi:hypothetical protein
MVAAEPIKLSVICPTVGGGDLARMFDSVLAQRLFPGDEVIIAEDTTETDDPAVAETCLIYRSRLQARGCAVKHLAVAGADGHDWGNSQRNRAIEWATGHYLTFMDDDDVYVVGAFDSIRKAAAEFWPERRPMVFRFVTPWREVLWQRRAVIETRIGGHQFVCPNDASKLGRWSERYTADFDFIATTLEYYRMEDLVWRAELIAVTRPDQGEEGYE